MENESVSKVLRNYIESSGFTEWSFAQETGIRTKSLRQALKGRGLTFSFITDISNYTKTPPFLWLSLNHSDQFKRYINRYAGKAVPPISNLGTRVFEKLTFQRPADILYERYIIPSKLNIKEFAHRAEMSKGTILCLLNGKYGITSQIAKKLDKHGIGTNYFWIRLQVCYDVFEYFKSNSSGLKYLSQERWNSLIEYMHKAYNNQIVQPKYSKKPESLRSLILSIFKESGLSVTDWYKFFRIQKNFQKTDQNYCSEDLLLRISERFNIPIESLIEVKVKSICYGKKISSQDKTKLHYKLAANLSDKTYLSPSEMLKEFFVYPLDLTMGEFCKHINESQTSLRDLNRGISFTNTKLIVKISEATKTVPEFWSNQVLYHSIRLYSAYSSNPLKSKKS